MSLYRDVTGIMGVLYISVFLFLHITPSFIQQVFLFQAPDESFDAEAQRSVDGVFSVLAAVIGPIYITSYLSNNVVAMDLSVVQRLFLPPILVITYWLGDDPFQSKNEPPRFLFLMIIVDVVGGIFHGALADGGLMGVLSRFTREYFIKENKNKTWGELLGWVGTFLNPIFLLASVRLDGHENLSLVSAFVSCYIITFQLIAFKEATPLFLAAPRVCCILGLLYTSEYLDFNTVINRIQAATLFIGLLGGEWFGLIGLIGKSLGAVYLSAQIFISLESTEEYIAFSGFHLLIGMMVFNYLRPEVSSFADRHLSLQAVTGALLGFALTQQWGDRRLLLLSVAQGVPCVASKFLAQWSSVECVPYVDITIVGRLVTLPMIGTAWVATGNSPFEGNSLLMTIYFVDMTVVLTHWSVSTGAMEVIGRFYNSYCKERALGAVEAWVILVLSMIHLTNDAVTSSENDLVLLFVATWIVGIHLLGLSCSNGMGGLATVYRLGVAATLFYISEGVDNNLKLSCILLVGSIGSKFGILAACGSGLYSYYHTVKYLEGIDDGVYYWCMYAGPVLIMGCSFTNLSFLLSSANFDQKRYYLRLHSQDWLMAMFCVALAGAMKRGDYLGSGSLGCWLAQWTPVIFCSFNNLSKNLIRRKSAPPHHPSWWVDNTFQFQDDSEVVNVSFSIATAFATVGLTVLLVIALVRGIGLHHMLIGTPKLSLFLVMHGFVLVAFTGFWMIFASSGMPPHGAAKMFRTFPPGSDGPILAVDPKNAIPPHKFCLLFGMILVIVGAFFGDSFLEGHRGLLERFTVAVWAVSLGWKGYVHVKDYGYVPKYNDDKEDVYERFHRLDREAKEKAH